MNRWRWGVVALLVGGHLGIDLLVVRFTNPASITQFDEHVVFAVVGLCVAHVYLIAVCAALAPGRLFIRITAGVALGMLMWYAIVFGSHVYKWYLDGRMEGRNYYAMTGVGTLQVGISIVIGILSAQIVTTLAAWRFRWRLLPPQSDGYSATDDRRFQLVHLLIATAVVSVLMALGRAILPAGTMQFDRIDEEMFIILPIVASVGLLVTLPCVWGAFVPRGTLKVFAILWFFYTLAVTGLEAFVFTQVILTGGVANELYSLLLILNAAQCISVTGTMLVLRVIGFRLVRLDKPSPFVASRPGATPIESA